MEEFLNSLFDNVGNKIKRLAVSAFVIETLATIIVGGLLVCEDGKYGMLFPLILLSPLAAFILTLPIYGFGEIIVKLTEIESNTKRTYTDSNNDSQNTQNGNLTANIKQESDSSNSESAEEFYSCPTCATLITYGTPKCPVCSQEFDWN